MPQDLAEQMAKLMVNSTSCTAAFTQWAGIEALTGPQNAVEGMVAAFRERRDVIVEGLNKIPGFRCRVPRGAFYAFPNIEATGLGSVEMQDYLLEEAGVAALAGSSFGAQGEGFLRLSYANSVPNIRQALQRVTEAIGRL
jgi:aspartate/methionine/tyrosine aminotransferase